MAKKKYYAVKKGRKVGVYLSWNECEAQVKGKAGALFKSFPSEKEARSWIEGGENKSLINAEQIHVYVDGSYTPKFPYAGWGFVVVKNDVEIASGYGLSSEKALSRNIDGEVLGALYGALWLEKNNIEGVLCYDYEGLGRWALKEWKANSEIAKFYVKEITPLLKWLNFKKVSAHSGLKWNDRADELAKKAIEEKYVRAKKK